MSLKSLINALFKLSGGQAMPSNLWRDLDTTGTITAPSDGWITLRVKSTVDGANPWYAIDSSSGLIQNYNASPFIDGGACCVTPVRKGDTLTVQTQSCVIDFVRFCPTVGSGGGLSAFCRKLCRGFGEVAYA